jgi:hypothetical protein
MAGFATLLSLGLAAQGPTYEEIRSPLVNGAAKRRRGRSTGQSMARRFSVEVVERLDTHGREKAEHEQ